MRVDQEWREANNENVGGETETQNDQRAGLCMWPLTAADRTSAPWWSSGFGAAHLSSININDTYGLPSRASPWEAGAGVTVDPSDNDKWTVTGQRSGRLAFSADALLAAHGSTGRRYLDTGP